MAKDFGRAASAKKFDEVSKLSGEKANFLVIKMLHTDDIADYPENMEDISDTTDLENSIREIGFTDPLEVTQYGAENGKYMIVSGHRRRAAGLKAGIEMFPCIVRVFESGNAVKNYVLLSNSQRDSSKDPLLYCKRYKMHEQYLRENGFDGGYREEIARRLGISVQQADRYNQFNKIILPVWDMVRCGLVGMSSVLPMAVHSAEEQSEIYDLLREHVGYGGMLTREACDGIIKGYRAGGVEPTANPARSPEELSVPVKERRYKRGQAVGKHLDGLAKCLSDGYAFEDAARAEEVMKSMNKTLAMFVDEMYSIGRSYGRVDLFHELADNIESSVKRYRGKSPHGEEEDK